MGGRLTRGSVIRIAATGAAVLVVGSAAAAAAGLGWWRAESNEVADNLPPATAPVTRQTLLDTRTETGELNYGSASKASARSSGTVTALAETGSVVSRGEALFRVDDRPVVLLYGTLPAYRALSTGTEGADVEQFEQNLAALGYTDFTVDQEYTSATASAVEQWQEDIGLEQTGTVDLGRVVYAADQVRIDTHEASAGDIVQPGATILTYTGTARVVMVDLEVSSQRLATVGAAVQVSLPGGGTVAGTIARAQTVIDTGSGPSDEPETLIEVTVGVDDQSAFDGLNDASVKVVFTAQERPDVLTVPVAALLALAEGGYGVEIVDGSTTRIVRVETGLFAGGRVEVSGSGLSEGMTVGVPS
jgi:peptidoglycan hydrolase-like protein with peptidoglycan-binding domain